MEATLIQIPEQCVFIFNFEQISHCSGVSIVDFEQVNVIRVHFL